MSLLQYGFRPVSRCASVETVQQSTVIPALVLSVEESGLGRPECDEVVANGVPDLANPSPSKRRRVTISKYTVYTPENRAKIGKYSSENGNERARLHFKTKFAKLKESTIRNFKKAYRDKDQVVTALPTMPRGRPPILMELDAKLINF